MGHIPIFLDVGEEPCLVIGGGEVATRKVHSLLDSGAEVTVISPALGAGLAAMAGRGAIRHIERRYRRGDLAGFMLVYAATDDPVLHREIASEAGELGIPINVADAPELCSFLAPAVVRQGELQIAISTGGASPAMAAQIRAELEPKFGPEYAILLRILRAARTALADIEPDTGERSRRLRALAASPIREHLARSDFSAVDVILIEHLGPAITLEKLGFDRANLNGREAAPSDRSR